MNEERVVLLWSLVLLGVVIGILAYERGVIVV